VVAAVVQLGPTSGFDTLVEAMTIVRQRRPGARLVVATRTLDGARPGGLPDWVELVRSNRASMPELLRPARVCVLPLPVNAYTNLAVPVRLLEFLALGKPTVVTATVETRSIVVPREVALIAPATPEGLASGILRVLDDERLAGELAARARAYACSREATWDARARTVLETLGLLEAAHEAG
jgi:glycosyltransferase involved in cell wall biosynthesis